jgi:hypothetical protein
MALWWVANGLMLLVVIPLVVLLANRVIRQVLEAARYADDILEHAGHLTVALEPVPALIETRERVAQVSEGAVRYVAALERMG